ncbi:hypothetical protein E2562_010274 [Oryza meyeriana var. granulata]|uniref:Uncharacterized protein n=1 Tax=Oryza meyeriana var. granulata TaxID=110450 RepID=A0A6G1EJU8_9ORYZ|nr:hypothetical protein E2562_010274 [Oryza meyeriana var. granulata]
MPGLGTDPCTWITRLRRATMAISGLLAIVACGLGGAMNSSSKSCKVDDDAVSEPLLALATGACGRLIGIILADCTSDCDDANRSKQRIVATMACEEAMEIKVADLKQLED